VRSRRAGERAMELNQTQAYPAPPGTRSQFSSGLCFSLMAIDCHLLRARGL
jgi:hypothetical protein